MLLIAIVQQDNQVLTFSRTMTKTVISTGAQKIANYISSVLNIETKDIVEIWGVQNDKVTTMWVGGQDFQ